MTVDHLRVDHRVRILADFRDARSDRYRAGQSGIIRQMTLNAACTEIFIEWERDGGKAQTMCFELDAKIGPRIGHMEEYFVMEEPVPLPCDTPVGRQQLKAQALQQSIPEVGHEPVREAARYDEALQRFWALAARSRFDEAAEQISLILDAPGHNGHTLERLAGDLVGIAAAHLVDPNPKVYAWLRERAINLWYAWGSQATSGGEGAAMSVTIRAMEAQLPELPAHCG